MIKLFRRTWRYFTAMLTGKFNEAADPKVQLEQAITEAQDQHRRLIEQAANVVANQKQTEMRLTRALEELEKVNASARQAVLMADEATKKGDSEKAGAVYRGVDPLTAEDVADCVMFALTRPWHVNVDEIVLKARNQSSGGRILRDA